MREDKVRCDNYVECVAVVKGGHGELISLCELCGPQDFDLVCDEGCDHYRQEKED